MFLAESAILVHLQAFGVVLFVLERVVVALSALCARKSNFNCHIGTSSFPEYSGCCCVFASLSEGLYAKKCAQKKNPP
jgi:hypothetical protein